MTPEFAQMTFESQLAWLKEQTRALHALLEAPEPGLFTWVEMTRERVKSIAAFWAYQNQP